MGNFALTRKGFSGTQSAPIGCGSHLFSGVDSVMTNPFNFDLLIFDKQVGIQNIARIIFKQSICFDSIKKKKKHNRKKERYYPLTTYLFMPERNWFTAEAFTALHMQHAPQKLFTRTRNICRADRRNSEGFFYNNYSIFMHPWKDGVGGRWLWTTSAFLLLRSLLTPHRCYVLAVQPRKSLQCSRGNKTTMEDAAHEHEALTGEEAEGAPKMSIQPKHLLVSLCLGVSRNTSWAPGWAFAQLLRHRKDKIWHVCP